MRKSLALVPHGTVCPMRMVLYSTVTDAATSRCSMKGAAMMFIISILALIGALLFRKRAPAAGIGEATKKGAAA